MKIANHVCSSTFAWLLLGAPVQAADYCTSEVVQVIVSAPDDADVLAESLMCAGSARVTVNWHGRVQLNRTVTIGNGSSLVITGSEEAVIDGYGAIPLLTVYDGATLELRNISLENGQADRGGALFANGSSIAIDNCNFSANNGTYGGGALYLEKSDVVIEGESSFRNNSGQGEGGGAMFLLESDVHIGGTVLLENNAASIGGAIRATRCEPVTIESDFTARRNVATQGGGAIFISESNAVIGVTMLLEENGASDGGGISIAASDVFVGGELTFRNNTAEKSGGGLHMSVGKSTVSLMGTSLFEINVAQFGGAIFFESSSTFTATGITVAANNATTGEGGGMYGGTEVTLSITDGNFTGNTGVRGGGLALYGVLRASVDKCMFHGNSADVGGGISSFFIRDTFTVNNSVLTNNVAELFGGGIFSRGLLTALQGTTFKDNVAGEGPAVKSDGDMIHMDNVLFEGNSLYCSEGDYGYDEKIDATDMEETCRLEVECYDCSGSCSPSWAKVMKNDTIPYCSTIPKGVRVSGEGQKRERLRLEAGYYRVSEKSSKILECYREEACRGGNNASEYCAEGYLGPYCAVCAENYAPGFRYSCHSCVGDKKTILTGVFSAFSIVLLLLVVFAAVYLLRVVEDPRGAPGSDSKEGGFKSTMRRLVNAVPLTAIRTVVVVTQIVSQFHEMTGVTYPALYEKFIAVIDVVNLNIGFIMSFSCIYRTDYYDELLYATLSPVVALGILAGVYTVARRRNSHSKAALRTVKCEHLSVALFVIFFVYPSVSHTIFQAFVCERLDDDVEYLKADYSLTCSTLKHKAFEAYATLMVFVYPIGIPAVFSWWLFRNRDILKHRLSRSQDEHKLEPFRDLWEPYKPQVFYFEIVEYARRVALTGLSAFIYPDSSAQVAIVLLLAASFGFISEVLSPFQMGGDRWLYRAGTCTVFLSMYLALLLKVDVSQEDSRSQDVFAFVLVSAHVGLMLAIVLQSFLWLSNPRTVPLAEQTLPRMRSSSQKTPGCESERVYIHDDTEILPS